jgi:integrating conjugative element protein (TIGR03765 family)
MGRFSVRLIFVILISIAANAFAEPLVIRDYGGKPSGVPDKAAITNSVMGQPLKSPGKTTSARFPLKSSMRSGVLAATRRFENKLLNRNPIFVVGNDERSRDWISDNKSYLSKINARGFVTNITSENEYRSLQDFAKPLSLSAIPLDELAQSLELRVYPVLITSEEMAQ